MDEDREKIVAEIKDKIRRGSYRVDPKVVADAMLRRMAAMTVEPVGIAQVVRARSEAPRQHSHAAR